ncbi:hypothetical protein BDV93DRAFT_525172 [Ceratobasidium sp. AG-I]|nr:hypothetical protein BDV93DRAFT_525172 [Ceratobasidium sp. AG-I]
MASVLSSSPGLVTLKLGNVCLHSPEGSERPSSVSLDRLKVLGLVYMHFNSLGFLLPLISPPDCSKSLSLGITVNEGFMLTPELEYFFERARVTTLYARGKHSHPTLKHVFPLLALLPILDTLGIDSYELEGASLSTSNVVDESGTSSSHALPSPSYIPKLCVVRCSVDIDGLSYLVSTYHIRYLHLEGCQALKKSNSDAEQTPNSQREIIEGYRISLSQKFPELECIVSEVDTVQRWPCCTNLPCTFPSS